MPQIDVFVINLKRSKDRRAYMEDLLGSLGLTCTFIEAVDGNDLCERQVLEIQSRADAIMDKWPGRGKMSRGEIGCALSHLKVYEKIVEKNLDHACILEDDVVIDHPQSLRIMLEEGNLVAIKKKKPFGLICLYVTWTNAKALEIAYHNAADNHTGLNLLWGRRIKINKELELGRPCIERIWGAAGYIVSKEACTVLLKKGRPVKRPSDVLMSCAVLFGINTYICNPLILGHRFDIQSTIDPDRHIKSNQQWVPSGLDIVRFKFKHQLKRWGIITHKYLVTRHIYYD